MILWEDTRQQRGKHEVKHAWWTAHNVEFAERAVALKDGDYTRDGSNVIIDTKRDIRELASNVTRDHKRVRKDYADAKERGWQLVILVENLDGVTSLATLPKWVNDYCKSCNHFKSVRCNPSAAGECKRTRRKMKKPIQGERLAKICVTMEKRYGVKFMFCTPQESARIICDLLEIPYSDGDAPCL